MKFGPGDIRTGKDWYAVQTRHYLVMFDEVARKLVSPQRFASQAEGRVTRIAALLRLTKSEGRYSIKGMIPYFVHDPKYLGYGNVEFPGIDVPASGYDDDFYRHEEAHAILAWSAGAPPAFFNEGFACFAQSPNSDANHRCTLVGIRHGFIPPLKDIAWSDGFWKCYRTYRPFMYRAAGSFVAWALATFGSEAFVRLAGHCGYSATRECVLTEFQKAYRRSLSGIERDWTAWLAAREDNLAMSPRRRMGNISQSEWERTRVQMVRDALGEK